MIGILHSFTHFLSFLSLSIFSPFFYFFQKEREKEGIKNVKVIQIPNDFDTLKLLRTFSSFFFFPSFFLLIGKRVTIKTNSEVDQKHRDQLSIDKEEEKEIISFFFSSFFLIKKITFRNFSPFQKFIHSINYS